MAQNSGHTLPQYLRVFGKGNVSFDPVPPAFVGTWYPALALWGQIPTRGRVSPTSILILDFHHLKEGKKRNMAKCKVVCKENKRHKWHAEFVCISTSASP